MPLSANGLFRWSIGTKGSIGTNRKWCHSNIGEYSEVEIQKKIKHAMCILRSISHLCKTSSLLHQVKTR